MAVKQVVQQQATQHVAPNLVLGRVWTPREASAFSCWALASCSQLLPGLGPKTVSLLVDHPSMRCGIAIKSKQVMQHHATPCNTMQHQQNDPLCFRSLCPDLVKSLESGLAQWRRRDEASRRSRGAGERRFDNPSGESPLLRRL